MCPTNAAFMSPAQIQPQMRFVLINNIVESANVRMHYCNCIDLLIQQSRQDLALCGHVVGAGRKILNLYAKRPQVERGFPNSLP